MRKGQWVEVGGSSVNDLVLLEELIRSILFASGASDRGPRQTSVALLC